MIGNPDTFQVILLGKRGSDNTKIKVKIGNEKIKLNSSVKLLGGRTDDKLVFFVLFFVLIVIHSMQG